MLRLGAPTIGPEPWSPRALRRRRRRWRSCCVGSPFLLAATITLGDADSLSSTGTAGPSTNLMYLYPGIGVRRSPCGVARSGRATQSIADVIGTTMSSVQVLYKLGS